MQEVGGGGGDGGTVLPGCWETSLLSPEPGWSCLTQGPPGLTSQVLVQGHLITPHLPALCFFLFYIMRLLLTHHVTY